MGYVIRYRDVSNICIDNVQHVLHLADLLPLLMWVGRIQGKFENKWVDVPYNVWWNSVLITFHHLPCIKMAKLIWISSRYYGGKKASSTQQRMLCHAVALELIVTGVAARHHRNCHRRTIIQLVWFVLHIRRIEFLVDLLNMVCAREKQNKRRHTTSHFLVRNSFQFWTFLLETRAMFASMMSDA